MKTSRPTEAKDIEEFLKQVDLVYRSSYMQHPQEQNIKLSWKKDEGLNITGTPLPERERIEAFLMRMRPIIVYEERLYIGKIITYLIEHSESEQEKIDLKKLQSLIEQHRNKRLFSITVNDKAYGMPDFVWLYLYGKYFHIDKEKQEIIQQFESVFGTLTEMSALSQIEGYAGLALFLGGYIKRRAAKKVSEVKKEQ